MTKHPLSRIIRLYQMTLSPDHGPLRFLYPVGFCRFYPSCSQYAIEAIDRHGVYGVVRVLRRLVRCNPWSSGGLDPLDREGMMK